MASDRPTHLIRPVVHRDVVCPFCGLGCDDLTVEEEPPATLAVRSTDCPVARERFSRTPSAEPPRVAGVAVPLAEAVEAAAAVLAAAQAPLVAGLGTDVDGARAALSLAERLGAVVDHALSDGLYRNLAVLQRTGWIATTLAELRNRCDLLLVAGPDPAALHPRLFERWVAPAPAFQTPPSREVVFLCGEPLDATRTALSGIPVTVLPGDPAKIGDAAAALAAALADPSRALGAAGIAPGDIAALAERLRKARYAVVAWAASAFDEPHADLTVERLVRLVRDANRHTRCAGLPLAGHDNVVGVNQVCTWRFGVPLRTSLAGGMPLHDPHRFAWARYADVADAVVWVSTFRPEVPAFSAGQTVIALAPSGTAMAEEPAVFIPVGTPGIDHPAHVFRSDTVVALRARRLIDRGLPDVATVLKAIAAALPQEAPTC
ncbi:formylmethanofuran dehydrogenase (plasmid) [Azospirillum baldaniorum]|uniref:Formylmethanofuran dehydrogenase subunit B n=1 Tax=Azospirillum baldaniorum TaxID=1064539 RepID=A0A9P1JXV3_9PROT|nr:formylmethanofuran dehydrogenase subunit B [Azospirillum baldaniorum]AWJ93756.1 formylmethanofuran dehydrogenase [Azospirillum baldaniorum]TWA70979.1 formylmethanofuran dehydrogenase subunit B [Azospirillum brasilense]CCD01891.1 putative Formylmethanofuran dehydrogenase subunit B [Azospirillum baldaniorum]